MQDFYICDHCKYSFDGMLPKPKSHIQLILFEETDNAGNKLEDAGSYKLKKCKGKFIPVNIVKPRKGGSDFSGW